MTLDTTSGMTLDTTSGMTPVMTLDRNSAQPSRPTPTPAPARPASEADSGPASEAGSTSHPGPAAEPRPTLAPRHWLLLIALASTGLVLFNVLVIATLRHTDSATLGSVVACSPLLLALAGPVVANSPRALRTRAVLAASLTVVAGSAMVQGFGHGTLLGIVLATGVLVCEVLFSLLAVPLLPILGELRLSAYLTATAVPILLVLGLATEGSAFLRLPSLGEAAALLYLALPLTVGAFLLWYRALQGLGPQRAGLLIGVVPVAACAASAALGVGTPGPAQLAGVGVVVAGIVGGLAKGSDTRGAGPEAVPASVPGPAPAPVAAPISVPAPAPAAVPAFIPDPARAAIAFPASAPTPPAHAVPIPIPVPVPVPDIE